MANITLATSNVNFPVSASPAMRIAFGSSFDYVPSRTQTALQGTTLWSSLTMVSPTYAMPGVLLYTFSIPAETPSAFSFGEMLLTDAGGSTVYAVGVLDTPVGRALGQDVQCLLYFDVRGTQAVGFGSITSLQSTPATPYYPSVNRLPPAAGVSNILAVVGNPTNPTGSLVAHVSYANPDVVGDFTSWSIENYAQISIGSVSQVLGPQIELPVTLQLSSSGVTNGQYVLVTSAYTAVCTSVIKSPSGTSVYVTLPNYLLVLTPAGTNYKFMEYVALSSGASAFVNQITVTPAQLNAIASVPAAKILLSDGSVPLESNLDFANFKGVNVGDPTAPHDTANEQFVSVSTGAANLTANATLNELAAVSADIESLQASVNLLLAWMLQGTGGAGGSTGGTTVGPGTGGTTVGPG